MVNLQPGEEVVDCHEVAKGREHGQVFCQERALGAFLVKDTGHALRINDRNCKCNVPLVDGVGDGDLFLGRCSFGHVEEWDDFLKSVRNLLVVLVRAHARRLGVGICVDSREKFTVKVVPAVWGAIGASGPPGRGRQGALVHLDVGHLDTSSDSTEEV